MSFGFHIKELRKQNKGWSARRLAEAMGIDKERWAKWEQLDFDPQDPEDVRKIEEYFGMSFVEVMKLTDISQYLKSPGSDYASKKEVELLVELSLQQMALSRGMLKGISEILGGLPNKTVTGALGDLDRAIAEEYERLKVDLKKKLTSY
ncbi:MAG: helix-turn-helix domain-containing protein [Agriterribacter sp.]